jgi:hypothetical protein
MVMPKASEALIARRERRTAFLEVMRMFLKTAALLALALFLAPALVLASAGMKHKHPLQVSPTYQGSDLSSLSVEDINRRTLQAAAAIRAKQAESPIRHQH